jgi:hypothetical protein
MQVDVINDLTQIANARSSELLPSGGSPPSVHALPSGRYAIDDSSVITVWRSADGRTWLAPDGQRAFDLVLASDTTAQRRVPAARRAVVGLLDSLKTIDCANVVPPVGVHPQAVPETLASSWCALTARVGPFDSAHIMGVRLPAWSTERALVFTRASFAHGVRVATWLFEGDQLVEMWQSPDVDHPQSVSVGEETAGVLLAFDWFRGRGERLLFSSDERGATTIRGVSGGRLVEAVARHSVRGPL